MEQEKVLTTIVGANKTSRLEVTLGPNAQGGRTVELRRLSWGDGVGWYCQQTLRLDPREAENLLWTLRGSRHQWRDQLLSGKGKVIPFPLRQTNQGNPGVSQLYNTLNRRPSRVSATLPLAEKKKTRQKETRSVTSRA